MAYDEELAHRVRELLADEDGLSEMRMFGGLAFLLDGNMSVAVSGQGGLMVRVDPDYHRGSALPAPHARVRDARPGDGRLGPRRSRGSLDQAPAQRLGTAGR